MGAGLGSGIEDLYYKRDELNRQIKDEEVEKDRLQHNVKLVNL